MPKFDTVENSGDNQEFSTGAKREVKQGRGRFDLLPPRAMRRLAQHYEAGGQIYGDRNWEKGMPLSKFVDCIGSHFFKLLEGSNKEDHLMAIAWNALGCAELQELIEAGKLPEELDDLPTED